jgi:hypothetical protein
MLNVGNNNSYRENLNYSFLTFINRIRGYRQTEDLRMFFQNNIFEITDQGSEPDIETYLLEDSKENEDLYKLNMIEESLNNIEFVNIYKVCAY